MKLLLSILTPRNAAYGGHEGKGLVILDPTLDGYGRSAPRSSLYPCGKSLYYPLYKRRDMEMKIPCLAGNLILVTQLEANYFTVSAIPDHESKKKSKYYFGMIRVEGYKNYVHAYSNFISWNRIFK
jgi:hypothetical protein